ncbi:ArsR/SmtB family transcription factor [Shouchella shacheensis]|uniref:ArsR/SmtB family transcription factor n=1 Tax=Shouchella shacheensis TaxID=1649580 RepID=UPI00074024E7|nr:metalloregulator ArsR/SmtB family transcription factor [Shouchella shacheensis]
MSLAPEQSNCSATNFSVYAEKFKALSDSKRLELLNMLCVRGSTCVCDLVEEMSIPQSKLSYHLKILLKANLIHKETKGTWSYYSLKEEEMNHLLSKELCCIINPPSK